MQRQQQTTDDKRQTMIITFQTSAIHAFLDAFAGRPGMMHYDDSKPVKISESNRDFVWPLEMQQGFIMSILTGLPIPAFTLVNGEIVDGGNRSTTLHRFRNGEFTVKVSEALLHTVNASADADSAANAAFQAGSDAETRIMNYEAVCYNRNLVRKWDSAIIMQQLITNATKDEYSQIYENLNKGIMLTCGQLMENRKHRPWVAVADSIIGRGGVGYQDAALMSLVYRVWSRAFKPTASRRELAFAFQVLVSAELGPQHFHSRFQRHVQTIMSDVAPTTTRFRTILEMIDSCDEARTIPSQKKKTIFTKFIGAIIYDLHTPELSHEAWREKWSSFITQAYNRIAAEDVTNIIDNITGEITWGVPTAERIGHISRNVARFLDAASAASTGDEHI